MPQPPQFSGSVIGSTQLPRPHVRNVGGQIARQTPTAQVSIVARLHAWRQAPQLFPSRFRSTQLVPQSVVPAGQRWHTPAMQACPVPQTLPQEPQFDASEASLTQVPAHAVSAAVTQLAAQPVVAPAQTCPIGHAVHEGPQ